MIKDIIMLEKKSLTCPPPADQNSVRRPGNITSVVSALLAAFPNQRSAVKSDTARLRNIAKKV